MKIIHNICEDRKKDFVNKIPYLDVKESVLASGQKQMAVDYCLGNTYEECGDICRQIITLRKM